MRGDALLATLRKADADQSWFICAFEPTPAFEEYRTLFEEEERILNGPGDTFELWEAAYARIDALGLRLVPNDGTEDIIEFLLHVYGNEAWLKY